MTLKNSSKKTLKILIGSILKPVDDVRHYQKIARSLSKIDQVEIEIIGYYSHTKPMEKNIRFVPKFHFNRLSISRLLAKWRFLIYAMRTKPNVVIICTHELIIPAIILRFLSIKVIYDVQENYLRNILFTNTYPFFLRGILALHVRLKELFSTLFFNYYFLAEECYAKEMSFLKNRLILGNKSVLIIKNCREEPKNDVLTFIYTGTIAESYGIFDAINFVEKLKNHIPKIRLLIVGYCPNDTTFQFLEKAIKKHDFIELIGGKVIVNQDDIIQKIKQSDFALLPYQYNKATRNRIPTKLYDYLALSIPILSSKNIKGESIILENGNGITIDFTQKFISTDIIQWIGNPKSPKNISVNLFWTTEEQKLIRIFTQIVSE